MKLSSSVVSDLLLLRQGQHVKQWLQIWDHRSFSTASRCTQSIPNVSIHRYNNLQCSRSIHFASPITNSCSGGYYYHYYYGRTNQPSFTRFLTTTTTMEKSNQKDGAAMADEYGEMTADGETYVEPNYVLESGVILPQAQLRYQTYGTLNAEKTNVLVICHALTGNASLHSWWGGLLGPGRAFDTSKYWVVCCNILGSAYGSTSPQSIDPNTRRPYGKHFPDVSVQDTVRLQLNLLQKYLGIQSIQAVIGGSFGGMQAMEFAVQAGSSHGQFFSSDGSPLVKSVIPIACGAAHTAWQIAISEVQRQAIYADPNWKTDHPENATDGLSVARQIGMVSYRTAQGYQDKFGRRLQKKKKKNQVDQDLTSPIVDSSSSNLLTYGSHAVFTTQSYLHYQGHKFLSRFDPVTYVKLTEQMDSHDISRGRWQRQPPPRQQQLQAEEDDPIQMTLEEVLNTIEIPARVMGIDSDVLYPLAEQEFLAQHMPRGELKVIHSLEGHDGFLLEQDQVGKNIQEFLDLYYHQQQQQQ